MLFSNADFEQNDLGTSWQHLEQTFFDMGMVQKGDLTIKGTLLKQMGA